MANWGGARVGAGRPKGAKSKRTLETQQLLQDLGCNPIEGLVYLATNNVAALGIEEPVSLQIRARAFEVLASYTVPRLKASEVTHIQANAEEPGVSRLDEFLEQAIASGRNSQIRSIAG